MRSCVRVEAASAGVLVGGVVMRWVLLIVVGNLDDPAGNAVGVLIALGAVLWAYAMGVPQRVSLRRMALAVVASTSVWAIANWTLWNSLEPSRFVIDTVPWAWLAAELACWALVRAWMNERKLSHAWVVTGVMAFAVSWQTVGFGSELLGLDGKIWLAVGYGSLVAQVIFVALLAGVCVYLTMLRADGCVEIR